MNPKTILTQIRQTQPKISVIGESIVDYWYFGRAQEPSQEDPDVGKFIVEIEGTMPGGAANVRSNLAVLTGAQIHHLTSEFVTAKYRWWDSQRQKMAFRWDDDTEDRNPFWLERLNQSHENVVISDYGKGMFTWERLEKAAELFGHRRVIFSPHLRNCRVAPAAIADGLRDWIWVMNWPEFNAAADSIKAADGSAKLPNNLIVTNGSLPVSMNDEMVPVEWSQLKAPAHSVGIGDVFLAPFAAAHFAQAPMREAVEYAIQVCRNVLQARRSGTCRICEEDILQS